MNQLGQYLKVLRNNKGFSLREVARKSGYSSSYLFDIESGRRTPQLFALQCIVEAMALTNEWDKLLSMLIDTRLGKAC